MAEPLEKIGRIAAELGGILMEVPLAEIEVGDRYRKDYGDLSELVLSLKTKGQLQNLVVVATPGTDKPYRLLAGGRRFRAMSEQLSWERARVLVFDRELDECECLEIEWEENGRRKDLDWKEDCAIKKRIHELRISKYGEKISSEANAKGASIRNTAETLNIAPSTLSEDVQLAAAQEVAPKIFEGCKTKKQAKQALKLATETITRAELARKHDEEANKEGRLRGLIDRYMVGDFLEGVATIPDASIDFVEIDPPYAINLNEVKKLSGIRYSMSEYNEVAIPDYLNFIAQVLTHSWRVMKPNSFGVLWFAPDPWDAVLYDLLTKIGFETTRLTGKWIKPSGQTHQPQKYLANACEEFYYFWKGNPSIVRQGRTNIFQYSPIPPSKKLHPTERPFELILELLSTFCFENSRIMVPFLGSGKTILAAEVLKMRAFGWDLSNTYKEGYICAANQMFGKGGSSGLEDTCRGEE